MWNKHDIPYKYPQLYYNNKVQIINGYYIYYLKKKVSIIINE